MYDNYYDEDNKIESLVFNYVKQQFEAYFFKKTICEEGSLKVCCIKNIIDNNIKVKIYQPILSMILKFKIKNSYNIKIGSQKD